MAAMALPETLEDCAPGVVRATGQEAAPGQDAAAGGLISPAPRLSIIIPVLNGAGDLGRTLVSLDGASASPEAWGEEPKEGLRVGEVVVADGGSSDASTAIAKDNGAMVVGGERGRGPQLAAGALSFAGGLTLIGVAALDWLGTGFGSLDYGRTMPWVIPGVTLAALGFQTILSGWFVSILGMARR